MADNYLEKRYEETIGNPRPRVKRIGHTLDDLLKKTRSCRGFDSKFIVSESVARSIISVSTKVASARNQQVLRFKPVLDKAQTLLLLNNVKMGAALPELHLPIEGTEPTAFIVVFSTIEPDAMVYIDLGIALQSMVLKATELGLSSLIIEAFDRVAVKRLLNIELTPVAVLALGKGIEQYKLVEISEQDSRKYYRVDGVHCVPKLKVEDIIL